MLGCLPRLQEAVGCQLKAQSDSGNAELHMDKLADQRVYVSDALTDPRHQVYSLKHR